MFATHVDLSGCARCIKTDDIEKGFKENPFYSELHIRNFLKRAWGRLDSKDAKLNLLRPFHIRTW
jgi:hypothetical protein